MFLVAVEHFIFGLKLVIGWIGGGHEPELVTQGKKERNTLIQGFKDQEKRKDKVKKLKWVVGKCQGSQTQ